MFRPQAIVFMRKWCLRGKQRSSLIFQHTSARLLTMWTNCTSKSRFLEGGNERRRKTKGWGVNKMNKLDQFLLDLSHLQASVGSLVELPSWSAALTADPYYRAGRQPCYWAGEELLGECVSRVRAYVYMSNCARGKGRKAGWGPWGKGHTWETMLIQKDRKEGGRDNTLMSNKKK